MIAVDSRIAQTAAVSWQQQWRECLRDSGELLEFLGLTAQTAALGMDASSVFPLRVPRAFAARMRYGDASDPLLRQVLPLRAENTPQAGYVHDPVGDLDARRAPGLLHKYQGRALLVLTGSCAVHCRYCFRRHYDYAAESLTPAAIDAAIEQLRTAPGITEVLLSGGDPLSLDTPKLTALTNRLRELPQLKRLRIHTRLPVVLPARVDPPLLQWLDSLPWPVSVVIHANHAQELDAEVAAAMARLKPVTQVLLNQSVLLRGVNDAVPALVDLSERLYTIGVLPYYLNQLDRVAGSAHFEVPDSRAVALVEDLRRSLPGYLVPRLVREVPGAPYKVPV